VRLEQLRYLVTTADLGTMTAAAAALHMSQPALTRGLRDLEVELGIVLLARRGRRVELTDDGRWVLAAARRALAEVDSIAGYAAHRKVERREADVDVAATPTLQTELGVHVVPALARDRPDLLVRVVSCGSRAEVANLVRRGEADLGLCDLPVGDDLHVVPIDDREVFLISPPGTALDDPVTIDALDGLPMVLPTARSGRRPGFDGMFAGAGVTPRVALECDERSSWVPAVLAGVGSCVWYGTQADAARRFGAEVRAFTPPMRRQIALVHRRGQLDDDASTVASAVVDLWPA
jgi:DNA-binding transcriptional LysR family regulator